MAALETQLEKQVLEMALPVTSALSVLLSL